MTGTRRPRPRRRRRPAQPDAPDPQPRAGGPPSRSAASGQEALKILREKPFDVVLLDIVMPELDGVSVLERLKRDPVLQHVPGDHDLGGRRDRYRRPPHRDGLRGLPPQAIQLVLLRARINAALAKKRLHEVERERVREVFSGLCPSTSSTMFWSGQTRIFASAAVAASGP